MTKILRLAIQGIRSFGSDDGDLQCISFISPLTLIVGQNGCGKTTIIESLKYATAGDLPKGQGQAFVHDPKMSGHSEVYGQVKLEFYDVKGEKVTVVRSLKSIQKAKDLKTSTIDQTITRVDKNGQKNTISQRCSDINAEMSRSLGVSKAVLENVIFCHQEDSTWPLDEPKKLKEKFDAIFDATKYNKCLEDIRKLFKEKKGGLGVLDTTVSFLKNYKTVAEEKRNDLATLERQLANLRDEIKEFNQKLNPISERLKHISQVENKLFRLQTKIATSNITLDSNKKQLCELRKNIKNPYCGSTEELRQAIYSFKNLLIDKTRCLSSLEEDLADAKKEEKEARSEVGSEQIKIGRLMEEEKSYKKLVKDCSSKLQSLATQISISQSTLLDEESPDYEVKNVLDQVERKVKSLETDFQNTRKQCKANEERLQSQVNEASIKKGKLEQEVHMKEEQLTKHRNDISKLNSEIEEVQLSAGRLTKLEEDHKNVESNLKTLESKSNLEEEKLAIQTLKDKRNWLDSKLEEVNKEIQTLQQQSKIQTQLDVHNRTKSNKEMEIKKLQRKHNDTLKHLLQIVPERGFKDAVEDCLEKLTESMRNLDLQIREKDRELTELDTNRKHVKEQLRRKEDTLRENEEKLYNACGSDEFDDVVRNLCKEIEDLQDQNGNMSSRENMFRRYIKKLQQEAPCCPLCHRDFTLSIEAEDLISDLNNQVRELPHKLKENKSKLKELEEKYSNLLQLKPVHEKTSLMKDSEIPDLRTKISAIESQIKDIKQEIDKLKQRIKVPQLDVELAKSAMNDMVLLDQSVDDLQRVDKEIQSIRAKMQSQGSDRTMDEALAEQESVQSEMQQIQRELERKQAEVYVHSEKMSTLREKRNSITSEILKIQGGLQASNSIRERLKELNQLKETIVEEISKRKGALREANEAFRKIKQEKEEASLKIQKELDDEKAKLDKVTRSFLDVKSLHKRVEDMKMKGIEQNVVAAHAKLARLQQKADDAHNKHNDIIARIDTIRSDLSTQQVTERELKDNLRERELDSEVKALELEIENLQIQMGDVNSENVREERYKLVAQEEDITRKKSHAEGRQREREAHLFTLEKELNKNEYKNADKNYRDKYMELIVQKKACEDLLQFSAALDFALKYFHRERMESINGIIRELWSIVYKGNDVDSIEIRTDEMGDTLIATDKRRSYSYRVVMKKKDVEMDMRGRCSAGQKMLASLIIRMALAETFSSHCGILALDEPTTNLDKENSNSLSEALVEIVKRRSSQKNFQLILITHDEEFVENLAKEESLCSYYHLSRDSEGKSRIKKHF